MTLSTRLKHQFNILLDAGYAITPQMRVLDFGCGEGNAVKSLRDAGYEAFGCEIEIWQSEISKELLDVGALRPIQIEPYRLPFDDGTFDAVLSNEVFEHVQDYPAALAELNRVMKPGAFSLHLFPARLIPIEPHVHVPFASIFRPYPWLMFWALLGVRNPYQRALSASETATRNFRYLTEHTNYPSSTVIEENFRAYFSSVTFVENLFIKHSGRGSKVFPFIRHFYPLFRLYRAFRNRVVLAVK